jgi:4-aminobutyrate aminotransferase-like enzyme
MQKYKNDILLHFPQSANLWILNGIIFEKQIAGIKKVAGIKNQDALVLDVLNSASSIALGAENPWLLTADRYEDHLGIKDNICTAYHPGIRQSFTLSKLAELYPSKLELKDITVHSESSGSIVNSIAIESAVTYADKLTKKNTRILAIHGTWGGSYGPSKEATGFDIDSFQNKKTGGNFWVDRCLPPPTKNNSKLFLSIFNEKIKNSQAAGIIIEPDIVGDLGIVSVDPNILGEIKQILRKKKLPIILDCVQQLGRTGGFWGEYAETKFKDFPFLIITTAKSASNGQPFGFTIMPKVISDATHPLSQITTNQMNGPLLRALVTSEVLKDKDFQEWINKKSNQLEKIALQHNIQNGEKGLLGKFLNRGIYVGNNENVKLIQLALFIDEGVLVGALPNIIRYQPMLLELSSTNEFIAQIIFRKIREILKGNVSNDVLIAYKTMNNSISGLARDN